VSDWRTMAEILGHLPGGNHTFSQVSTAVHEQVCSIVSVW
jgi:hypothetical protein